MEIRGSLYFLFILAAGGCGAGGGVAGDAAGVDAIGLQQDASTDAEAADAPANQQDASGDGGTADIRNPACQRPVGELTVLPFDGSLYLPDNFHVFIEAPGSEASEIIIRTRDGNTVAESSRRQIAPGLYAVDGPAVGCSDGCRLHVELNGSSETFNLATHPLGGSDNIPPTFTSSLSSPTDFVLQSGCERPVTFNLEMSPARNTPEDNGGNPQTSVVAHVVERKSEPGEWVAVGSLLQYTNRLDVINVTVNVEENLGVSCYRAFAVDTAGNMTTDTSSVCFDTGL